jgi:tRNA U55 pseudouridine synthase TruB
LGTGAYLSNLVRLRAGPFHLCQAITIDELTQIELPWVWPWVAVHPDIPVQTWPALILDEDASRRWRQGSPIPAAGKTAGSIRVYDAAGDWLGTGDATPDGSGWQPRKVVAEGGAALRGAAAGGLRGEEGEKEHEGSDRRSPHTFSPLERSDPP